MAEGASFDSEQGALLEAYYARYCQDPQSVPAGWRAFFSSLPEAQEKQQRPAQSSAPQKVSRAIIGRGLTSKPCGQEGIIWRT